MDVQPTETLFYTFRDYLDQSDLPAAAQWGEKLLELGVSSETFRVDADTNEVVQVLVSEGVPRIPEPWIFAVVHRVSFNINTNLLRYLLPSFGMLKMFEFLQPWHRTLYIVVCEQLWLLLAC